MSSLWEEDGGGGAEFAAAVVMSSLIKEDGRGRGALQLPSGTLPFS
jgi:hypothetical protein